MANRWHDVLWVSSLTMPNRRAHRYFTDDPSKVEEGSRSRMRRTPFTRSEIYYVKVERVTACGRATTRRWETISQNGGTLWVDGSYESVGLNLWTSQADALGLPLCRRCFPVEDDRRD